MPITRYEQTTSSGETITNTLVTADSTVDEVRVRCRKCFEYNRDPSTFNVLSRLVWPEGHTPEPGDAMHPWNIHGLQMGIIHPVAVYTCGNRACTVEVRIKRIKLKELYEKAVERRLDVIYLPL